MLALSTHLLPELNTGDKLGEYHESRRTEKARQMDELLGSVRTWLWQPGQQPTDLLGWKWEQFLRYARQFFFDLKRKLHRRREQEKHTFVVEKDRQMYMMQAAHDALGHGGTFATKALIEERFW